MHEHSLRVFNLMLLDGHVEEKLTDTTFFNKQRILPILGIGHHRRL